jgi:hypothetical protein
MELTFECPHCETTAVVESVETAREVKCASCGDGRSVRAESFDGPSLRSCAWCATPDLYIQKDFPHALGLAIVLTGFVSSTVFWYFRMPVAAFAALLSTALLDLVLYYLVPDVTICYRCLSQFRGSGSNPDGRFQPFDLAIGERYRQERLRIEELKQKHGDQQARDGS